MSGQQYPEPTVGALIFNQEGKLFLMKSSKWNNKYVIPGGHIEIGETMESALKREIREETNLEIFDLVFICLQEFIFDKAFWKKRHFIFLDYACKTKSKTVKLNSEGQEFIWIGPKESLNLLIEPYSRATIVEFLKKFPKGF
jgi:nucleoside triphosphatase